MLLSPPASSMVTRPAAHAVAYGDLPLIDRNVISQAEQVFQEISDAYGAYQFSRASKAMAAASLHGHVVMTA